MSPETTPEDRRYTKSHEWIRLEGEEAVVGITDHAQAELTDIVFVDLPKVGATLASGATALVLESVKTVADVYAPFAGKIVAVNESLKADPGRVNRSPYDEGWLFRQSRTADGPSEPTLSAAEYQAFVASESH